MSIVSQFLSSNGDGTGTSNCIGDYSSAALEVYYSPPAGQLWAITRMIVSIEDTSGMQAQEYGNLGGALTNGITVKVAMGGAADNVLTPDAIKTNGHWPIFCHDSTVHTWGSGNEVFTARWTFAKAGSPVVLGQNDKIVVTLNDDFTGLINHHFLVQGHRRI